MKLKQYKNRKEFMKDLINLSAIEIYEEVLSGRYIKRFPCGFWQRPEALNNAKEVTKYLIEKRLKWSDEDIKKKLDQNTFVDNKLCGMIKSILFDKGSTYKAINNAYPDKFKPWEFKKVSMNYWNKESAKEATIWLIEDKLKWSDEDIKEKLNTDTFRDNGLMGMINTKFNNSPYETINNAYPDKFKSWELRHAPQNYWTLETSKVTTKWLIEDKLKWNDEDIKNKLNMQVFADNGLAGMAASDLFYGSTFKILNNAYPDKFKKSDLKAYQKNGFIKRGDIQI